MKTIGLCMIVKNESHVILRCLDSVRPLIDYVLVEDTGSTDGTQQIIRDWLARENLPGDVFDAPWQDFAHNRTLALARLRERPEIDYALIMDADDVLVLEDGFDAAAFKAGLDADYYNVSLRSGDIKHHRASLCSNRRDFQYRGVLHEYLAAPEGSVVGWAAGLHIFERREGARSQDPDKYRKDAECLALALESEQDPLLRSRYTFYMAQSWRDCGEHEKALAAYLSRAELGFWDEEIFVSLYNAAQLKERLGHSGHEIIAMYLHAYEACARRAEALHGAARYCRNTRKFRQGYMFAKQGLEIPRPRRGLFLTEWIYDYGLLDEFAVNAYKIGWYEECLESCELLLVETKISKEMRQRVETNAHAAREKLAKAVFSARDEAILKSRLGSILGRVNSYKNSDITSINRSAVHIKQVHLINLDRSPERLRKFQKLNAHLTEVIKVSAVDGADITSFDKKALIEDGTITERLQYPSGTLACAISHINLWKKAVSEDRVVTIFEDDTVVSYRFQNVAPTIVSRLPSDWGIIKWGHNFNGCFLWLDLEYSKSKVEFYNRSFSGDSRLQFQAMEFSWSPFKFDHSFGLMAYSISPLGASVMLRHCLPLRPRYISFPGTRVTIYDTGLDCAVNLAFPAMKAFVCMPPLALHDDDDVSDRMARNT
ncbi:MAG TPA: glycosyltransferase family 25 protein [Stellaceae bacterium]|jgi:GR25 family glycosyltransferase involved in LPS biosynthesis|nr:glycosyltransferase family 25 protein [Stellaceae bacterium]